MGNLTAKTSGEIASFMTPAKTNIKSLKVHFSPKQLGTGDPSPENVREIEGWDGVEVNGSGKNLIPLQTDESYWSIKGWVNNNGSITLNSSYRACDYQKALPNKKYILTSDSSMWLGICFYDEAYNEIAFNQKNNTIVTLESPQNTKYYRIYATYRNNALFQLEISSDATSYEPYQGDTISYQWKLPDEYQEVEYIESTGTQYIVTDIVPNYFNQSDFYIKCALMESGTKVFFGINNFRIGGVSFQGVSVNLRLRGDFSGSTAYFGNVELGEWFEQKIENGIVYCLGTSRNMGMLSSVTNTEPLSIFAQGVNETNTRASARIQSVYFDDHHGDKIDLVPCYRKSDGEIGMYDIVSKTFYTNQGTGTFLKGNDVDKTFYGGYVDLISGELTITNVQDKLGAVNKEQLSTRYNTSQTVFFRCDTDYTFETTKDTVTYISDFYCESLKPVSLNWGDGESQDSSVNTITQRYNSTKAVCMRMYNSVFDINADDTVEIKKQKINTWLAENPIIISYKLAEPITHQLTPTQLKSFVGQNNFWSNADYVEIEYDLIETEDIQKCRKKIMLNQPHTESVIGDVANFSTNMKAPLKECKVYFNPIQEGSGNPSPDNVRNIIGWDGVNVGLPDEYQEVEYIESSGTQYIITDIPIQQPVTIYIDVMPLSGSNDQAFFVASYEAGQTVRVGTGFYASRIQNYYQRYYTLGEPNSMKINTKHHAEVYLSQGLQTAVLDGTQLSNTRYTHDSTLLPIDGNKINFFMFAEGRLRTSDRVDALFKSHARIYALKVDNADSTIGNFIPCYRKSDGEIGMYDTVSKTFYTNSGTGTFLKGDDVNIIIGNVSWSDEIGTVYGGYVDLVKGEVVATYKKTIIDGSFNAGIFPWQSDSIDINTGKTVTSALYLKRDTGDNKHNRYAIFYCNKLKNISNYNINEVGCSMYDGNSYSVTLTLPKEDVGDTQETLRTYLSNNPIEVVFELAEPIHYQLTPQQLLTFKGENNIWSDTNGQTEVKFWTH